MITLSELLTIDIQTPCSGGVYLRWENDYGGMDSWYFDGNNSAAIEQSNQEYFHNYVEELADVTKNFETLSLDYGENIRCKTMFDKANAEGFKQLLRSKNIQMYSGGDWYTVAVMAESFILERNKPTGKLDIQVILPKTYVK
jgi:hypothetical protein